jgi:hypothetical protein
MDGMREIGPVLRRVFLLVVSGAATTAACGGQVTGGDGGGTNPSSCTSKSVAPAQACTTVWEINDPDKCGVPTDGGTIPSAVCAAVCNPDAGPGPFLGGCQYDASSRQVTCTTCAVGRMPEGLEPSASHGVGVGGYLAQMARLEAAAVIAFETLHEELAAHGAHAGFLREVREAQSDEVRHARSVGALARRRGATVEAPVAKRHPVRDLESIARENAVEGCVRETLGAVVGRWQAARAEDPAVRRVMARIAREEERHAALSWRLAAWFDARLDDDARTRVRHARDAAIEALSRAVLETPEPGLVRDVGLPTPEVASAMVGALRQELWS